MKRNDLRMAAAGTVAAMTIGGAAVLGTTTAQAQDNGHRLAGTWVVTVQPLEGPNKTPFESRIAYTTTGSVVEATSRAPMSAGLGTWKRLGSGRFTTTVEKYRFNGPMYIGKTVIQEVQELSADGSKYTGQATTTIVNNDGTRVTFRSTSTGHRA